MTDSAISKDNVSTTFYVEPNKINMEKNEWVDSSSLKICQHPRKVVIFINPLSLGGTYMLHKKPLLCSTPGFQGLTVPVLYHGLIFEGNIPFAK